MPYKYENPWDLDLEIKDCVAESLYQENLVTPGYLLQCEMGHCPYAVKSSQFLDVSTLV